MKDYFSEKFLGKTYLCFYLVNDIYHKNKYIGTKKNQELRFIILKNSFRGVLDSGIPRDVPKTLAHDL